MATYDSVLADALALPPEDRELLLMRLGWSLREERPDDYDEAWRAEIRRRMDEVEAGTADLMDWEEFRAELMKPPA